jgi:hypothetical protein
MCSCSSSTTEEATPLLDALYEAGELDSNVFTMTFCGDTVRAGRWGWR